MTAAAHGCFDTSCLDVLAEESNIEIELYSQFLSKLIKGRLSKQNLLN